MPLVGHWNAGTEPGGFSPAYQMRMINQGHHLLPWFQMPGLDTSADDPRWIAYYEPAIRQAAELKLPLSLVGTQWEAVLSQDPAYLGLPAEKNPNVVTPDGQVRREVSPFGPVELWREAGRRWASSPMMRRLQAWYPDPPKVLFVSNNEAAKLSWTKAEDDRRFLKLYGRGRDDDFKRRAVSDGWIERYRALQQGMREGLTSPAWRAKAIFIGYDAFGPPHFGRWHLWMEYSLYAPGRIDPSPLAWDGGSPSFYVFNWSASTDYTVFGPQVESMNWVFMLGEAYRLNPNFWFEISTWDGHEPSMENDKRKTYAARGQRFTPERYGGMVQFGMWLLRPRLVREFRAWRDTLAQSEAYFLPIIKAVDRLYTDATLGAFWRKGRLVPNRAHPHPYQTVIPGEYQRVDRWFLLDTNLDPPRPWTLSTELPVFSLALVEGQAPERRWLLYAHAPLGDRQNVLVTVPEFGQAKVDVPVAGALYLIDEKGKRVKSVG